jgi:hypothetical protein
MGVATTTDAVRRAVETAARAIVQAQAEQRSGHVDFVHGVEAMKRMLLHYLDTGGIDDDSEAVHMDALEFCFQHCAYGKRTKPGEDEGCIKCALHRHTIGGLVSRAFDATNREEDQ